MLYSSMLQHDIQPSIQQSVMKLNFNAAKPFYFQAIA